MKRRHNKRNPTTHNAHVIMKNWYMYLVNRIKWEVQYCSTPKYYCSSRGLDISNLWTQSKRYKLLVLISVLDFSFNFLYYCIKIFRYKGRAYSLCVKLSKVESVQVTEYVHKYTRISKKFSISVQHSLCRHCCVFLAFLKVRPKFLDVQ